MKRREFLKAIGTAALLPILSPIMNRGHGALSRQLVLTTELSICGRPSG